MASEDDTLEIENAVAITESTDALEVQLPGGRCYWLPKRGIHDDSEVYAVGHHGTLVLHQWLAEKKGLC